MIENVIKDKDKNMTLTRGQCFFVNLITLVLGVFLGFSICVITL